MGDHFTVSPFINSAVSCLDMGFDTILPSRTLFLMSGSISALMSALLSLSTMCAGVLAGAWIPPNAVKVTYG